MGGAESWAARRLVLIEEKSKGERVCEGVSWMFGRTARLRVGMGLLEAGCRGFDIR
jgi:hypothetical protein